MSGGSPVEIMFIVLFSDISLVLQTREISLHKTIHMISTGDPPFTCSCYNVLSSIGINLWQYTLQYDINLCWYKLYILLWCVSPRLLGDIPLCDIQRCITLVQVSGGSTYASFGLVKYPYTKQFTWSPQGFPLSLVLVIMFCPLLESICDNILYNMI